MTRPRPEHPLRVQPLLLERRPFVTNTTEVSKDPLHFLTPANGFDPTERLLHAMVGYAVPQEKHRQVIFHTVDAVADLHYRELAALLAPPFTTEFWSMCELVSLQRKRRHRPLLRDLPSHFLIGSWVVSFTWNTQRGLFIVDAVPRARYVFPAGSRIFRPRRV
jgi:hypothetical protein